MDDSHVGDALQKAVQQNFTVCVGENTDHDVALRIRGNA